MAQVGPHDEPISSMVASTASDFVIEHILSSLRRCFLHSENTTLAQSRPTSEGMVHTFPATFVFAFHPDIRMVLPIDLAVGSELGDLRIHLAFDFDDRCLGQVTISPATTMYTAANQKTVEHTVTLFQKLLTHIGRHVCRNCSQEKHPMKLHKCAACAQSLYCGKPCQDADWARHKRVCKKIVQTPS
jgi:hypothetical protein